VADITSSLTSGELLLVARKRIGLSQSEMASFHGTTRTKYGKMERDQMEPNGVKLPTIGSLATHEEAMILRRRAGHTQKEIAGEIGLSRHWVSKMETGQAPCERLLGGMNG